MSPGLLAADYAVIGTVLTGFAAIGLYFRFTGGRQRTAREFLLADKNSGVLPVSFSLMATVMSAISVLGNPSEVYFHGLQIVILEVFFSVGTVVTAYCVVPVFFTSGSDSVFEYLEKRFGKILKIAVSLLYSVQMILYMPVVVYAPSLALSMVTGLSVWTSVITMAVVCTFYSTLGGLKAVLWTDLFQGLLMLVSMILLIVKGSSDFGGFYKMIETADKGGRLNIFNTSTDPSVRYTFWNVAAQGVVSALYYFGATYTLVQRLISCGTLQKAQSALLWNIPLCVFFRVSSAFLGVVIYSYFHDCDPLQDEKRNITRADQLVPYFILTLFGHLPGLPGFCIAGIFSAALSTMSSIVNSLAAVTVEDYIRPYWKSSTRLSESKVSLVAKALAFFYGFLCLILTFVIANAKSVIEVAMVVLGMVGGPTLGVLCLGIFTVTANEGGSLFGLVVGFAVNAWMGFGTLFHKSKYPPLPLSTEGCQSNSSFLEGGLNDSSTLYVTESSTYTTVSSLSSSDERSTHLSHNISFMWFATISFVITITAGYVASFIIGRWRPNDKVNPQQISPFVRRWIGYHVESCDERACAEVSQNTNLVLYFSSDHTY